MTGAADLVAALTGGKQIEQQAYGDAAYRIMQAREAQANMDKRVQEAAILKDQLRSRGNFERNSMDMPPELRFAILAGLGSDYNQGQQGAGHGIQNNALAEALKQALAGGDPDAINRLVGVGSGKLLGPGNVKVGQQADADIAETVASAIEKSNMANFNQARAVKAGQGDPAKAITSALTAPMLEDLSYKSTVEVPNPDYDPDAWFWQDAADETITKEVVPLHEFQVWQALKGGDDPASPYYQNERWALAQWRAEQAGNQGTDQSGSAAQDARNKRTVYKSVADLQADIAAGVVKSGDTIQTPEGPRVVK